MDGDVDDLVLFGEPLNTSRLKQGARVYIDLQANHTDCPNYILIVVGVKQSQTRIVVTKR